MPSPSVNGHDLLVSGLWEVSEIDAIQLVARYQDTRIGTRDKSTITIFLPDSHLVRRRSRHRFKTTFNDESVYIAFLKQLVTLRHRHRGTLKFSVVHLGDFMDLWKENTTDPALIVKDHIDLCTLLTTHDDGFGLKATMLYGNHDADLRGQAAMTSNWDFRRFFPARGTRRVYTTHGDIFSLVEKLPDSLQKFIVYHFTDTTIGDLFHTSSAEELGEFWKLKREAPRLDLEEPQLITRVGKLHTVPLGPITKNHNVKKTHEFMKKCRERVTQMNQQRGFDINSVVLAHTHNARIAVPSDEPFLAVMDCGAWVGKHVRGNREVPNRQIGVIWDDEYRIYQLDTVDDRVA